MSVAYRSRISVLDQSRAQAQPGVPLETQAKDSRTNPSPAGRESEIPSAFSNRSIAWTPIFSTISAHTCRHLGFPDPSRVLEIASLWRR